MDKRNFIKVLGGLSISPFLMGSSSKELLSLSNYLPKIENDEELWKVVRSHYKLKDDYINLESGYYCILPQPTLEHFIEHVKHVNYEGSYYMRNYQIPNKDKVTSKLAKLVNTNSEELVITRNSTESLDLIISGFNISNHKDKLYLSCCLFQLLCSVFTIFEEYRYPMVNFVFQKLQVLNFYKYLK